MKRSRRKRRSEVAGWGSIVGALGLVILILVLSL